MLKLFLLQLKHRIRPVFFVVKSDFKHLAFVFLLYSIIIQISIVFALKFQQFSPFRLVFPSSTSLLECNLFKWWTNYFWLPIFLIIETNFVFLTSWIDLLLFQDEFCFFRNFIWLKGSFHSKWKIVILFRQIRSWTCQTYFAFQLCSFPQNRYEFFAIILNFQVMPVFSIILWSFIAVTILSFHSIQFLWSMVFSLVYLE